MGSWTVRDQQQSIRDEIEYLILSGHSRPALDREGQLMANAHVLEEMVAERLCLLRARTPATAEKALCQTISRKLVKPRLEEPRALVRGP